METVDLRRNLRKKNMNNKWLHGAAFILVIVGGLNWLLLALTGWEIGQIFGGMDAALSQILYILVGLSAIYLVITHKKDCKMCEGGMKAM